MAEARGTHEGLAIGIDLGTTFSCMAIVRNGDVEVITNDQGDVTTPSVVAFNDNERIFGAVAKHRLAANAENTIFDAKRLIGRKFDDPIVQNDMKQWPFKVVDVNGKPEVEITYRNEVKRFSAEEISAMILGKMKEMAETYLNEKVANAVITVPAYFNDLQRKATKDAGEIAGLNVIRIINEPTAAAIAYGMKNDTKIAKNVLVYDLGGGTFDVSILNIHKNIFEVKAIAGETHLGGEDFDNRMMEKYIEKFKLKHNVDISGNNRALRRLRSACEKAKRILSSTTEAYLEIDSLADGIDFADTLARNEFEEMCADFFLLTMKTIDGALKDANMKSKDIDTIVLVGGSTRIPKIKQLLQEKFPGKEICKSINADEAVARGAAVQAAIIHGGATSKMKNMKLMEVTPLTLGITVYEPSSNEIYIMGSLIKRNTPIPVSHKDVFVTVHDNQTNIILRIIQGERRRAADNFEIGSIEICGIPPAPAELEEVEVTFSIDENGILTVTAVSLSNPKANGRLTIKNVGGSLTKAEIKQMVADAEIYREQDREIEQYKTARCELEQYCQELKEKFESEGHIVVKKCNETLSWLDTCSRPKLTQFRRWKEELESLMLPPKDVKRKNEFDEDTSEA